MPNLKSGKSTGRHASKNYGTTMATTNNNLNDHSAVGVSTPGGDFILNYPYTYDNDVKNEVLFQEKLFKAGQEQGQILSDEMERNLYGPVKGADFAQARDFA